jgi:hypothetical protein
MTSAISPPISFHEARQIAELKLRPEWNLGTFHVFREGYDLEDEWVVIVGAEEWLVGNDQEFMEWDAPVRYVNKRTGAFREVPWADPDEGVALLAVSPPVVVDRLAS